MFDEMTANVLILTGFGLYAGSAGLGMLIDPHRVERMMEELRQLAVAAFLAGILVLVIGLAILGVATPGPGPVAILVQVLGWGALAEGVLLLVRPDWLMALAGPLMRGAAALRIWGAVTVVLAVAALWLALG
ncbi:hypothetical protein [Maricaulis sp. CAU 1757]